MRKFTAIAAIFIAAIVMQAHAFSQSIAIKGKIVTNDQQGIVDAGTMLITDGRISSISADQNTNADRVIEGENYWITPGLFASFSSLGLVEVSGESSTNNSRASGTAATVSIRAADSFNPKSTTVPIARLGGVLHAAIVPGPSTDIFGGIGAIASTSGSFTSVLDDQAFIYLSYAGSSERTGSARGAAMAYLRAALDDAQNYTSRFNAPQDGNALRRADALALRPALDGQIPLLIGADRAIDIINILALKTAYPNLDMVIVGAAEGWMVGEQLANSNTAVIIDPLENLPYSFDRLASRSDNAKLLHDAGVKLAFMTRSVTGGSAHNIRLLTQYGGNTLADGLDWDTAFKAISLTPASLFGAQDLAILKRGQRANFVVWDGDPLEVTSAPIAVFIDGQQQELTSRQTKLRDRYNPLRDKSGLYGYPQP